MLICKVTDNHLNTNKHTTTKEVIGKIENTKYKATTKIDYNSKMQLSNYVIKM